MKILRVIGLLVCFLLAGRRPAFSQTDTTTQLIKVLGHVDEKYHPLGQVSIEARKAGHGAVSNEYGQFELMATRGDTLVLRSRSAEGRFILPNTPEDVNFYFDMATGEGFTVPVNDKRGTKPPQTAGNPMPQFPWPVPTPSTRHVLDRRYFIRTRTLADTDKLLREALRKSEYPDPGYYQIPNGFALVSPLEQIEEDGSPKTNPTVRWSMKVQPLEKFTLANYLRLLFTAAKGHFRMIVFLVTDVPTERSSTVLERDEAQKLVSGGVDFLPAEIGQRPFTANHQVVALIYEFEKPENGRARLVNPSSQPGLMHLTKSRFLVSLTP